MSANKKRSSSLSASLPSSVSSIDDETVSSNGSPLTIGEQTVLVSNTQKRRQNKNNDSNNNSATKQQQNNANTNSRRVTFTQEAIEQNSSTVHQPMNKSNNSNGKRFSTTNGNDNFYSSGFGGASPLPQTND